MFLRIGRLQVLSFLAIAATILAVPLGWRAAMVMWGPPAKSLTPSYLPALEAARARRPFEPLPIDDLKSMKPSYVIIGDSMAGRIDRERLTQLAQGEIAPVLQNATGSAYWFLVFKNYVIPSGITPKGVIVFFRDTNLTDPMFRIGDPADRKLDEVALDRESELNAVLARRVDPWFRWHRLITTIYVDEAARAWLEPKISEWATAQVVSDWRRRPAFVEDLNRMFSLDHLRPTPAADIEAGDRDTDFDGTVDASVLPLFLRLSREHHLPLCFVRVLRRPVDGQPPPQSSRMTEYVAKLRRYLESHGAVFRDDRAYPEMAAIEYGDGDHIGRGERVRYTDQFFATTPIFR